MSAPNELEEILGSYGIVRRGKEPWVGVKNIESDTLFEDLENLLLRERLAELGNFNLSVNVPNTMDTAHTVQAVVTIIEDRIQDRQATLEAELREEEK